MGARIDCYLDIGKSHHILLAYPYLGSLKLELIKKPASFYSYIAFVQILKNKQLFDQHSVEVEFVLPPNQ